MFQVDLNSDLGESFGAYQIGMDADVIAKITSANVACGYHAGSPDVMERTIRLAKKEGAAVGAHPGFPDLMGFGRRNLNVSLDEARQYVIYQIGALTAMAKANGVPLQHVKPHGALYNMAVQDMRLAEAIAEGVASVNPSLILLGLSGSCLVKAGRKAGLRVAAEIPIDRGFLDDGTLAPRSREGAVLEEQEEVIDRAVRLIQTGKLSALSGKELEFSVDSLCVHGDNPSAVALVRALRRAFKEQKIQVKKLSEIVEA
ncbi:5-oxoprolinase subunit PxpA [Cuneatibacter sp. NSJ-177]|uniref:LamB/YcsF family protein n=1 Tax=Cuneatibacter sp. NSJ-177 TaxID=2931401 RepID=UPI001FD5A197|nr:5-oxoprolinase subunit PxpA [Cuneatibacter sp. NSJ-177]MCJ7837503.1 5-oxoprolinase subunit PxpA [Cuneatibacter sp. NSJ-177]